MIINKFLFNFSASYSGGGFKRLQAFAKWFNQNGGAYFIIHPRCNDLKNEFQNNHFIIANQSRLHRFFNDCDYLDDIQKEIGKPDVYYSYGIPVYFKFGRVNWFHLSNVLPLGFKGVPQSWYDSLKLSFLGRRITRNYKNVEVISAESNFSLTKISPKHASKNFLSVNGGDDEILFYQSGQVQEKDNIATMVGTYLYKAVEDSYFVFKMLQESNPTLKLVIIGDTRNIPDHIQSQQDVIMTGLLQREAVIEQLKKTEYYISTTYIENSYNAASEGVFFANESVISDIGPHRELLEGMCFDKITVSKVKRPMLRVKREDLFISNLKSWDTIVTDILNHASLLLSNEKDTKKNPCRIHKVDVS